MSKMQGTETEAEGSSEVNDRSRMSRATPQIAHYDTPLCLISAFHPLVMRF